MGGSVCSVLFYFLRAMCHFGGGETFNNAAPRSSRSALHIARLRSRQPRSRGAQGQTRGRREGDPEETRWHLREMLLQRGPEPHTEPNIQISGGFLSRDFQLCGCTMSRAMRERRPRHPLLCGHGAEGASILRARQLQHLLCKSSAGHKPSAGTKHRRIWLNVLYEEK